ncbi:MAG: hypothetical protein ACFCU9_13560 [Cyanophyceae cyanobacterium]
MASPCPLRKVAAFKLAFATVLVEGATAIRLFPNLYRLTQDENRIRQVHPTEFVLRKDYEL